MIIRSLISSEENVDSVHISDTPTHMLEHSIIFETSHDQTNENELSSSKSSVYELVTSALNGSCYTVSDTSMVSEEEEDNEIDLQEKMNFQLKHTREDLHYLEHKQTDHNDNIGIASSVTCLYAII